MALDGIAVLSNGNYVVRSGSWDNGAAVDAGAATFCNGTTGCVGMTVSTSNSLHGSTTADEVGRGVTALTNGNYVVSSTNWDNVAASEPNAGAATWCDGTIGRTGPVTAANSLVGDVTGTGAGSAIALTNGNYVVVSQNWSNPANFAGNAGAVTFCNGTTGRPGEEVTSANSLVGSSFSDFVGNVTPLTNGNYVVTAGLWDNGTMQNVGAATFCSGTSGCTGPVTPANSLIGSAPGNSVGGNGALALANGNYVVLSGSWDNGATSNVGALTPCNGTSGLTGTVSPANSLAGSTANDFLGSPAFGNLTALSNGDYIALSAAWDNSGTIDAGAVTYGLGNGSTVGPIVAANSVRGTIADGGSSMNYSVGSPSTLLVVGRPAENIVTVFAQGGAPAATSAVSRKIQSGSPFDINLPLAGNAGIECRSGGATNDYQVVFTFANSVTFNSAAVSAGAGSVSSSSGSGTTAVTVNLTGVTNAQRITVTLSGVNNGTGTGDVSVQMGVLVGDTNGDGVVNAGDSTQTKNRSGQPTDGTNFRSDVNEDGTINSGDSLLVKSRLRDVPSLAAASVIKKTLEHVRLGKLARSQRARQALGNCVKHVTSSVTNPILGGLRKSQPHPPPE